MKATKILFISLLFFTYQQSYSNAISISNLSILFNDVSTKSNKKYPKFKDYPNIVDCNIAFFSITYIPFFNTDVLEQITVINGSYNVIGPNELRIIPDGSGLAIVITIRMRNTSEIFYENSITIPIEQSNLLEIIGKNSFCNFSNVDTFQFNYLNNTLNVVWNVTNGTILYNDNNKCIVEWNQNAETNGALVFANLIGSSLYCSRKIQCAITSCCEIPNFTKIENLKVNQGETLEINNQNIQLLGNISVKGKLFISNSNIKMGDFSEIIIKNSGEINLNNTQISSCNNMWEGIKTNSSSSKIYISYSTIEDAKTALEVKDAHTIFISNSIFNKNRNHLDLFRKNTGLTYNIFNNTFDCWNGSTNMCLKSPFLNSKTQTAFKFDSESTDHDLSVGFNGSNIIRNASMGLHFLNASATISNFELSNCDEASVFVNMKPFNFNNNNVSNCLKGITCYNSETNVNNSDFEVIDRNAISSVYGGTISVNASNFVSISTAVYANYISAVNISNCNVNKVSVGFRMLNNKSAQVRIEDNILANVRNYGIYQVFHYNGESIVKNNQINLVYPVLNKGIGCGIYFAENEKYQGAKHRISLNQITNAKDGIWFTTITNSNIFNNTISMYGWDVTDQQLFNGIKLENSLNCQVRENSVSGSSDMQSHYWVNGIFVENSDSIDVHCNFANNLGNGMVLSGNLNQIRPTGNYFGRCNYQFVQYFNPAGLGNLADFDNSMKFVPFRNKWFNNQYVSNSISIYSNKIESNGFTNVYWEDSTILNNYSYIASNNIVVGNENFVIYKPLTFQLIHQDSISQIDIGCNKDYVVDRNSSNHKTSSYDPTFENIDFENRSKRVCNKEYLSDDFLNYFKQNKDSIFENLNEFILDTTFINNCKLISNLNSLDYYPIIYTAKILAQLDGYVPNQKSNSDLQYFTKIDKIKKHEYLSKSFDNRLFSIYPNPTKGLFTVETQKDLKIINIQCYDLQGKMLLQIRNNKTNLSNIDCSLLSTGIYFLKIYTDDGKINNFKIVIEP